MLESTLTLLLLTFPLASNTVPPLTTLHVLPSLLLHSPHDTRIIRIRLRTMITTTLLLASLALVSAAPQPINHLTRRGVNLGFPYGQEKIRGVNLGGVRPCPSPRSPRLELIRGSGLFLNLGSVSLHLTWWTHVPVNGLLDVDVDVA